jgi:hypothetical protein
MSSTNKFNFEIYYKINKLINEYHSDENINKTETIILLYNDGEIVETKGGKYFLQRTLYTKKSSLNNITFKMPCKYKNNSYSVLPSLEVAELIRNHMKVLPSN